MAEETTALKILFLGEPSSPNTNSWIEGLEGAGCKVYPASVRKAGEANWYSIGNPKLPPRLRILTGVPSLKRLIKKLQPDIIIAYRVTSYGYLAARTGFHPLILAAQNEQIVYLPRPSYFRRKFLNFCVKYAIKRANLIHSWGKNITNGLKKFEAEEKKILTLHRGIDTVKFNLSLRKKEFDKLAPVFISTRTLAPEYLIDKLITGFGKFVKQNPKAQLIIAGTGTEEASLKELTKDLKLENNIIFKGRVNQNILLELLNASDFYISVIATEGISSSLIESIACGLCPIAVNMPASKILINDKENGLLIPCPKVELICNTMIEAVSIYDKIHKQIIKNAENIIRNYNRTLNQKKFINAYKAVIKNEY